MPSCQNYFGKIFAHLGAGLAISAASAEYSDLGSTIMEGNTVLVKFVVNLIVLFGLMYVLFMTAPGSPFKYASFAAFAFWLGQTLKPYWSKLEDRGDLRNILLLTAGIFVGMMAIGFYDNQNLLGFGPYLFAGLAGLILAQLLVGFLGTKEEKDRAFNLFRFFGLALFSAYTAYDVQVIKMMKSVCGIGKGKNKMVPDYPVESLNLYLDFLNLFNFMGSTD